MLVDIIIPAYNPGKFLLDAVKSCLAQKYSDYVITVVDDSSDEDVKGMLSQFPSVRYLRSPKNLGPGGARNLGINSGEGELISLLDADDIMHPSKLKLSVEAFKQNTKLGMVCGNYRILVNRSRLLRPFYKNEIFVNHKSLMKQNLVASGSTTFKRSVAKKVGLFSEKYWICEDYDMWIRIAEKYSIKYLHKTLYYYSVIPKGNSLTQRGDIQVAHMENIRKIKAASIERMSNGEDKSR